MNMTKIANRFSFNITIPFPALAAVALLMMIVTIKAFILEDAFIVFRSIQNFHNGFFFSAIADIRSQSYTSNLWTLLLLLGGFLSRDLPNVDCILSLTLTLILALGIIKFFSNRIKPWLGPLAVLLLALSGTFTDYSTGGLENSLAHIFLATFFLYAAFQNTQKLDFFILSFIAGLIAANRYDHVLLTIPVLALAFIQRGMKSSDIIEGVAGLIPLWLWMGFAWFYYGSAFPDTYYAKINTGVPVFERLNFAVYHHLRLLDLDFFGGALMLLVMAWGSWRMGKAAYQALQHKHLQIKNDTFAKTLAIIAGLILYNVYFFEAGGDYMTGRFASVMVLTAILSLSIVIEQEFIDRSYFFKATKIFIIICIIKLCIPHLFVPGREAKSPNGITRAVTFDMRRFEQNWYFLRQDHGQKDWRRLGFDRAIQADQKPYPFITVHNSAGIIPYYSGSRTYIIDPLGLSDPLLSRLPCTLPAAAAHCERNVPEGYQHFLETHDLSAMDPDLARYVDPLFKIKTMPLFSMDRIKLLFAFTLGKFDSFRQAYIEKHKADYYQPGSAAGMFRHAYGETILSPILGPLKGENYAHPWW